MVYFNGIVFYGKFMIVGGFLKLRFSGLVVYKLFFGFSGDFIMMSEYFLYNGGFGSVLFKF